MAKNQWWFPWAMTNLIEPGMRKITTQIPKIAEMKAGEKVLDVCCGTGGLAFIYAQAGLIAEGIDLDQRVIKVAEKKATQLGLSNASFQKANALDLSFEDNSFDHVSITMAIHEVDRSIRNEIISEMKRVVRQQGTLIFLDYMAPLPQVPSASLARFSEFIAGRDHNLCFKDFLDQGGLPALLKQHQLLGERKGDLGIIELVLAKTEKTYGSRPET